MKKLTFLAGCLFVVTLSFGQKLTVAGNIGIGVDPPVYKLDILSTNFIGINLSGTSASGVMTRYERNGYEVGVGIGNSNDLIFRNGNNTDARITSAGDFVLENGRKLGINTASPTSYFHLNNTGLNATDFSMWVASGNGLFKLNRWAQLHLQNSNGNTTNFWHVGHRDDNSFDIAYGIPNGSNVITQADAKLSIQSDGRVGIGTTTPGASDMLTVVGGDLRVEDASANLELSVTGNGNAAVLFQEGLSTRASIFFDNSEDQLDISYSGSPSDGITVKAFSGDQHIGLSTDAVEDAIVIINANGSISKPQLVIQENNNSDYSRMQFRQHSVNSFWDIAANGSNADFRIRYDNGTVGDDLFIIDGNNDRVGINRVPTTEAFEVQGGAGKTSGGNTWVVLSDARLKKDVRDFTDGLEILQKIHPVWFRYNGKAGTNTENQEVGILAQEMQHIAPYMIGETVYEDEQGKQENYLNYNANALFYILVNAVKEQQLEIEHLQAEKTNYQIELDEIRASNADLQQQLDELKQLVQQFTSRPSAADGVMPSSSVVITGATLEQNQPNPFTETTLIQYFIPETVGTAALQITNVEGKLIKLIPIKSRGKGQTRLEAQSLQAGTYFYTLLIDGKVLDTKQMMLTR